MWSHKKVPRAKPPQLELVAPPTAFAADQERLAQGDAALDGLGAILRTFGQYAFDLDLTDAVSVQRACEAWALHVLVAAARPGAEAEAPELAPGRRDWAGLRQFVLDHRRREQQYVAKALSDFRQVVASFVESFQDACTQDQETDERVFEQLARLRLAFEERSTEALKREALEIVGAVAELVEARRQRQRTQLEALSARVSALGAQLQEVTQENALDDLTRLFNRRALDEYLDKIVALRDLFGKSACLLMVDVDHFKAVNDTYGHPAGDAVLRALADGLVGAFLRRHDFVARYGGEEFVVVLPETPLQEGSRLAERLLDSVRGLEIPYEDQSLRITVSVGIATLAAEDDPASWLVRADRALYQAKHQGRDRLVAASD